MRIDPRHLPPGRPFRFDLPIWIGALSCLLVLGCGELKRRAYEGSGREDWQQSEKVIQTLGIEAGDFIADVGAGGGYFTFDLAEATGPSGVVYAIDVDPDMTAYLEKRSQEVGADNVEVVLADYDDPKIPSGGVDLLFSSNTYHHLQDRVAYFERTAKYLRPGGRIAIIEYKDDGGFHLFGHHYTDKDVIRGELEQAGFRLLSDHDFLEKQNFLVFSIEAAQER
ncbi:MAG: class I SAM-dependent methyltransferase [Myxococcota bacterium]